MEPEKVQAIGNGCRAIGCLIMLVPLLLILLGIVGFFIVVLFETVTHG